MFDHLTFTLAQDDAMLPPPPSQQQTQQPSGNLPSVQAPADSSNTTATQQQSGNQNQPLPPAQPKPFMDPLMIVALAVLAFMFFFTITSSRKEKKKRAALAASLKKGSRVRTIGGMMGTIAEIRDDNTVVIKVDENANTRIKFDRSAIAAVLEDKAD